MTNIKKNDIAAFCDYVKRSMPLYSNRSQLDRAHLCYMEELLETLEDYAQHNKPTSLFAQDIERIALNGAGNWWHYSMSGCSLCYNDDIAERLLPPSRRLAYSGTRLLDMQASALRVACSRLKRLFKEWKNSL